MRMLYWWSENSKLFEYVNWIVFKLFDTFFGVSRSHSMSPKLDNFLGFWASDRKTKYMRCTSIGNKYQSQSPISLSIISNCAVILAPGSKTRKTHEITIGSPSNRGAVATRDTSSSNCKSKNYNITNCCNIFFRTFFRTSRQLEIVSSKIISTIFWKTFFGFPLLFKESHVMNKIQFNFFPYKTKYFSSVKFFDTQSKIECRLGGMRKLKEHLAYRYYLWSLLLHIIIYSCNV